jgi:predicted PurR-regulated permease PerM
VIIGSFVSELDEIGALVSQAADEVARWAQQHDGPLQLSGTDVDDAADSIGPALSSVAGALFGGVLGGASLLAQMVAGTVLALAFLIYLLTDGERVGAWLVRRFAPARRPNAHRLGARGWATLGGYVRGVTTVALFDAVLIGAGLFALDVPIAGALTVLVFLAAFIPIAGAWVSGAVCVAVALAGNGVTTAAIVVVLVLIVQEIESLVLNPIIYRNRVNLHPVVTLGAVTAGGVLAGIIGALIAVPAVALVWAVVDERDHIKEERERAAAAPPPGGAGLSPAP